MAVPLVEVQAFVAIQADGAGMDHLAHAGQFAVAFEVIYLEELKDVVFIDLGSLSFNNSIILSGIDCK